MKSRYFNNYMLFDGFEGESGCSIFKNQFPHVILKLNSV